MEWEPDLGTNTRHDTGQNGAVHGAGQSPCGESRPLCSVGVETHLTRRTKLIPEMTAY